MTTTDTPELESGALLLTLMTPWEAAGGEVQDPFVEVAAFADLGRAPYIEIAAQVGDRDLEQYWRSKVDLSRT
jgi:hypothetical protein